MSSAPPSGAGAGRTVTIQFESGRRIAPDALRMNPAGATLEVDGLLRAPLKLTLGQLQIGMVDRGPAKVRGAAGRFPILKRLSATAVLPREQGIEGWLWTSTGGSAFTELLEDDEAPNLALVFTQPLEADVVEAAFEPELFEELAKRSPLGSPTVFGVLLRAEKLESARAAFTKVGLVRPLTDREVPPTQRKHLPTDRAANPQIVSGGDKAEGSVAPPGMG